MKNLKRFNEFSRELNEYYTGGFATRGSSGYEPPDALSGFKNTFGQGKGLGDLFGAGGALSRDRANKPDINKGIAAMKKNIMDRAGQKKGFLSHLMGGGKSSSGGESPEDYKGGDVSRLKGSGGSPAAGAAAGAAGAAGAAATPSGGGAPQSQAPASVPSGVGMATSDRKWKSLVAALSGIKPKSLISPERGGPGGIPGGKVQNVDWSKFALREAGMKKEDAERFPLTIRFDNIKFIGDQGNFSISSVMDKTRPGDPDTSKDVGIAERIDDFWRKKNYRVYGPKKDFEGKNRTDSDSGKYAFLSIYFDVNDPNRLKTDLQEMLNKFGVLTSTQRSA
jgi:hypothetical protein